MNQFQLDKKKEQMFSFTQDFESIIPKCVSTEPEGKGPTVTLQKQPTSTSSQLNAELTEDQIKEEAKALKADLFQRLA